MGRLFFLLIVAIGLAPGTWVRSHAQGRVVDDRQILFVERLPVPEPKQGEVEVAGAWHLTSPNWHFGGFSALVPMDDATLLAITDSGRRMRLGPPGDTRPTVWFDYFATLQRGDKRLIDMESLARDPLSGAIWATYENIGQIERYDANLVPTGRVRSWEMQHWPSNTGPEAMARLPDGRFIVLSEGSPRWLASEMPALLFPSDPVEGARPQAFRFRPPRGYRPVDMAPLPDGRVLILLRQLFLDFPPRFESKLVVADPAEISAVEPWIGREIAHLAAPMPTDNYEGLAIEPGKDGRLVLWLISDDNFATFQRTLLLKLLWRLDPALSNSRRRDRLGKPAG